jgi:hypothetical protein
MKRFAAWISLSFRRPGVIALIAFAVAVWTPIGRADAAESSGSFILDLFGLSTPTPKQGPGGPGASDPAATHEFKKAVALRGSDGAYGVQTFCIDGRGQLVALVAQPRYYDASAKKGVCEIHVLSAEGERLHHWQVDFLAQSINTGPDGTIYVAGDGTIARYSADGKLLKELKLPHIAEILKDKEGIRKQGEEQSRAQRQGYESIRKQFTARIKAIESKPAAERSRMEERQLEQYRSSLQSLNRDSEQPNIDAVVKSIVSRLTIINSVAVSNKDIFIVCGETTGYGYALWRLDHDFGNATQVMKGMRGCCGQMDVQIQGAELLVAENCEHAFARYDRDGKKLGQWGKMSRSGDVKCFGGCCNPMNVRCGPNGDVLTAESEGLIKRFNSKGDFVSLIGNRPLTGGCKNVSVGSSADGKLVYFCDQPGSQIVILAEKPKAVTQAKPIAN